jgi:hypothetical protein
MSGVLHRVVPAMLVVVGIIHLLPLSGVLGSERLAALYGLNVDEPNLALLMRHRSVLFGLLGAFLLFAAFKPALQTLALVGAAVSVLSFLALAWSADGVVNAQVQRVVIADVAALVCLVVAGVVHALVRGHNIPPGRETHLERL